MAKKPQTAPGYKLLPGRKYETPTGHIITRRQYDKIFKLAGESFESKAERNKAENLQLALSRAARGRKKAKSSDEIIERVKTYEQSIKENAYLKHRKRATPRRNYPTSLWPKTHLVKDFNAGLTPDSIRHIIDNAKKNPQIAGYVLKLAFYDTNNESVGYMTMDGKRDIDYPISDDEIFKWLGELMGRGYARPLFFIVTLVLNQQVANKRGWGRLHNKHRKN